jgi:para-aminobenzoate synthetase component 1
MFAPVIERLPDEWSPAFVLSRLYHLPYSSLLESSRLHPKLGRYSFFAAEPFDLFRLNAKTADPLAGLARRLKELPPQVAVKGLPPMQGGAIGMLSYDLGQCFERIPAAEHDEFGFPLAVIGFYDTVFAWDHHDHLGWIISQGLPERDDSRRLAKANERVSYFKRLLQSTNPVANSSDGLGSLSPQAMAHGLTAEQFDTRLSRDWFGTFDSPGLRAAIERVRSYIAAGDVFQVNIAQRLMRPAVCNPVTLYLMLRECSPAPFGGYFDGGGFQLISSSPERFLKVDCDQWVETRPIKGTRPRGSTPEEDHRFYNELSNSAKDRAENTMIVDLLRNDLSRVCTYDSISVPEYCVIEKYPQVQHLVSAVRGQLRKEVDITGLLSATFPGGSITGAPKVRAMEIIAELEPTARGPYCGSLGYISLDGTSDWNILIRTILSKSGWWQLNVGGGIVYDSDSVLEEEETWIKAKGMVSAIEGLVNPSQKK